MATINNGTYTPTVVTAPSKPSTTSYIDMNIEGPLIRTLWQDRVIDEPKLRWEISSARSFFTGDSLLDINILFNNLHFGQILRVPIKKDQNPLSLYQSDALTYKGLDDCASQLELDCSLPCISTAPEYETVDFAFDTRYAYGVRACVATEDFYDLNWYSDQYALSRAAMEFGREVDLWNKVITGLIASPAVTSDITLTAQHPTQYWSNLGAFNGQSTINTIRVAASSFMNAYDVNPSIIMTPEMANKIVASTQTEWNYNATWQKYDTFEQWDVPGVMIDEKVRGILGLDLYVFFLHRSNWLTWSVTVPPTEEGGQATTKLVTKYPLWSQDLTKEYVAILDPRVGYEFSKAGPYLNIMPYDCDKMLKGMIDTVYTGSGITFSQYGMILEFNRIALVA